MVGSLQVGKKDGFTFLPHINTRTTLIDMQGMICIQMRSEEHRHGKFTKLDLLEMLTDMFYCDKMEAPVCALFISLYICSVHNNISFFYEGVTGFYGMDEA